MHLVSKDPSIVRVGEDYFLATSTFEFFPGVPIYHSRDLIQWETIGHALNRPSQLNLRGTAPSGGIFAPTLRHVNGTFYLITTLFDIINPPDNATRTPRSFYVTTDNIWDETTWSDPTYVDQPGFDPDLFFDPASTPDDDDDVAHLTTTFSESVETGNFANWLTTISPRTGNSLTPSRLLHTTTVPRDQGYPLTEGSHLYRINGSVYMLTADSGTEANHKSNVYRLAASSSSSSSTNASTLTAGPWEANPHNPVLWNGRDMSLPVLSTGHADLVEGADGRWWAVFLATRPQHPRNASGVSQLGRETFLCPVEWDADGWPTFCGGDGVVREEVPEVLYELERPRVWRDEFDAGGVGGFVDKGYYFLRTPYKRFVDFESRPGWLRLHGNLYTLSQRETPAAVLRKQVDFNTTFSAELTSFEPEGWRQEAGVSVYLSIHYHDEIAVTVSNVTGRRAVVTHVRSGPEATLNTTYHEDEEVALGQTPVRLFIEAKEAGYRFGYAVGEGEPKYVASVENKWLQAYVEGWQNFVGSHFAIYNTGTNLPTLSPADFNYIQTELN
ncbi:Non-reducing end alpha-L-arabinofuranosidase BoGH43B [Lasiodiplodia theobromae]|uniref:Non-reducing end alpha-L-arabinofuranosidase BoGH43B n=1 Tax=Lasiodiplodia theobromae TaxID=45133 RepID=A0A5N5CUR2_9PEZI|nr:Non-reducing end alpha-L-arabinofuranosidase BoGH43B [Lasiodiplodia theobromae]